MPTTNGYTLIQVAAAYEAGVMASDAEPTIADAFTEGARWQASISHAESISTANDHAVAKLANINHEIRKFAETAFSIIMAPEALLDPASASAKAIRTMIKIMLIQSMYAKAEGLVTVVSGCDTTTAAHIINTIENVEVPK
jgi:hypothetical protein